MRVVVPLGVLAVALTLLLTKTLPEGPHLLIITPTHGIVVSDVVLLGVAAVALWFLWRARRL